MPANQQGSKPANPSQQILGHIAGYLGVVEPQMRKALRINMVIHLHGFSNPRDLFRGGRFVHSFRRIWLYVARPQPQLLLRRAACGLEFRVLLHASTDAVDSCFSNASSPAKDLQTTATRSSAREPYRKLGPPPHRVRVVATSRYNPFRHVDPVAGLRQQS